MLYEEQDSSHLIVELPQEQKNKLSALMSTWQFTHNLDEEGVIKFYLIVNDVYLGNLMTRREEPKFIDEQRRRLGPNCILNHPFVYEWANPDGHHSNRQQYRGELIINYSKYKGLTIMMTMGELELGEGLFLAKMHYYQAGESDIRFKTYHLDACKDSYNTYEFLIEQKDIETYLHPRLAIELAFHKQLQQERKYLGIRNQGNTCYQNSILQILFFIRPLRKIVLEEETDNKTFLALREIFMEMMDVDPTSQTKRSVDAERLIVAYGRFSDYPRRQQDIHQYLLGFLEELEGACPSLQQLWQGTSRQQLDSREEDKHYHSNINQEFTEIDIHMEHQGNTFEQLIQPLQVMTEEELVDDKIDTDQHGKITVSKRRYFTSLPNIIFFNLKRYRYSKEKGRPTKVLANLNYPLQINLAFLMQTPSGNDDQYLLYALAVHRGQTSYTGHYFSLVNTSCDLYNPQWCRFNDSQVFLSSEQAALSFTGGDRTTIIWSSQYKRFIEKSYPCEQTAYLLVYIRRQKFAEYQQITVTIPKSYFTKKRKNQALENKPEQQVQIYVLNTQDKDLFGNVATMNIPLIKEEDIFPQLTKIQIHILGGPIGSVWKVSKANRKIKRLRDFVDAPLTPGRIFTYRRGHRTPDYLLIIPFKQTIYRSIQSEIRNREQTLGIVKVSVGQGQSAREWIEVIAKASLDDFVTEQEKKREQKGYIQQKQAFIRDWNDFCQLNFSE